MKLNDWEMYASRNEKLSTTYLKQTEPFNSSFTAPEYIKKPLRLYPWTHAKALTLSNLEVKKDRIVVKPESKSLRLNPEEEEILK